MPLPAPAYCRPEAYELFAASVPRLDSTYGLLMAAMAVSMHELDDVEPGMVDRALQNMVDTVRSRVSSENDRALLAHAHHLMFEELGFRGDTADYYHQRNSYLPSVLATRTGLPITLCLIYKIVLERLGLEVHGINAPGHFMARVDSPENGSMLVDPFAQGKIMTAAEACGRASAAVQKQLPCSDEVLPVATHQQWIARLLRNLYAIFLRDSRPADVGAVVELSRLLKG